MDPVVNINFGAGDAEEMNLSTSYTYGRVFSTCPTDGHYAYTPYTSDCFRGDWITLTEDHTPGDMQGNMLLVNASYQSGEFYNTMASGLKPGAYYEFSVWMLNVCKPSDKCPFPLLPDITIQIRTPSGNTVSALNTGELQRYEQGRWAEYSVMFKMPTGINSVDLIMINSAPGGCGNDFAMDDITFRECVMTPPPITKKSVTTPTKKTSPSPTSMVKRDVAASSPQIKKPTPKTSTRTVAPTPVNPARTRASIPTEAGKGVSDNIQQSKVTAHAPVYPPPAPLVNRTNSIVKRFETGPGVIKVELYDNGLIDGDTVSIYHNNKLILSHARLSDKPISFTITIDANNPHHELVMVANNLGSIPPNTSLMYVYAGPQRYEVFISSNEQTNAKVIFDLKE
jgi:hypothetical protein